MAYIYQIQNDINNKIYIGKTEFSIEKRWKEHCKDCKREEYKHRPLYRAMNKYGIEHFHISLLEETNNPEERENYWIEKLSSFKYGYNATIGGDGKKYLDWDLVIATYKKTKSQKETAKILDINDTTVHNILLARKEKIYSSQEVIRSNYSKIVDMYNLKEEYLRSFPTLHAAADFMIENKLTRCKHSTIRTHISEVCNNKRKTAAGFIWHFNKN